MALQKCNILVFCVFMLHQSCEALIMQDPATGIEVDRFASPVLSRFVGPTQEVCSNATGLVPIAVPADKNLCNPPDHEDIVAYSGKLLIVPDVFRNNPLRCTPEKMLRNAAASGAKGVLSVLTRKTPGNTIVYKGTGEPSNEGTIPFLAVGTRFMTNVSFDFKTRNMSTPFVFDITCDTSEYEVSVYYIGPTLFTILGLFAFRTSFYAMKAILHFRKSGSLQVSQTAILSVLFFMNFIDGIVLVFGIAGYTTNSWILGNENITYSIKQVFSNVFMGCGLLATLWTGIFWSLLQKQTSKMSSRKGSPNIFKQAPIRTALSMCCTIPLEMYMSISSATWNNTVSPIYAPLVMLVSLGAGFYFFRQVNKFFKLTGFKSKTARVGTIDKATQKSGVGSTAQSKPNIPPFILKLARALKRFSVFLLYQMIAILLVQIFQFNTNPWGQNFSSFIFASGTFGMAYYLVQGLAPSKSSHKRSRTNSAASSKFATSANSNTSVGGESSVISAVQSIKK